MYLYSKETLHLLAYVDNFNNLKKKYFIPLQASHLSSIKNRIREEVALDLDIPSPHIFRRAARQIETYSSPHRGPRKRGAEYFSPWSTWAACDVTCKQKRERYCIRKKKCGETKHVEERTCPRTL